MKLTPTQLRRIIREAINASIRESIAYDIPSDLARKVITSLKQEVTDSCFPGSGCDPSFDVNISPDWVHTEIGEEGEEIEIWTGKLEKRVSIDRKLKTVVAQPGWYVVEYMPISGPTLIGSPPYPTRAAAREAALKHVVEIGGTPARA